MPNEIELAFPSGAFEPVRDQVEISIGNLVRRGDTIFRIAQALDFESVIGVDVETGRSSPLRIGDLRSLSRSSDCARASNQDIAEIADEDWRIAQQRLAAIKPLLDKMHIGRDDVEARGKVSISVENFPPFSVQYFPLLKAAERDLCAA